MFQLISKQKICIHLKETWANQLFIIQFNYQIKVILVCHWEWIKILKMLDKSMLYLISIFNHFNLLHNSKIQTLICQWILLLGWVLPEIPCFNQDILKLILKTNSILIWAEILHYRCQPKLIPIIPSKIIANKIIANKIIKNKSITIIVSQ